MFEVLFLMPKVACNTLANSRTISSYKLHCETKSCTFLCKKLAAFSRCYSFRCGFSTLVHLIKCIQISCILMMFILNIIYSCTNRQFLAEF